MNINDTIIITRHDGLVQWLAKRGITGMVLQQAEADDVRGKTVIGALPLHLAAMAEKIIVIDLPRLKFEQRGKDLSADEMDKAGATMKTYVVRETEDEVQCPQDDGGHFLSFN